MRILRHRRRGFIGSAVRRHLMPNEGWDLCAVLDAMVPAKAPRGG